METSVTWLFIHCRFVPASTDYGDEIEKERQENPNNLWRIHQVYAAFNVSKCNTDNKVLIQ